MAVENAAPRTLERAAQVRLVLLDADGVLTDGVLYQGPGGADIRAFSARDGLGIRIGQRGGLQFAVVSGRVSAAVAERAEELDFVEVHQAVRDKAERMHEISERLEVAPEQICFVGDDLIDLPVMRRVGLAVAPRDAVSEALDIAHHVTERDGGQGVVREVVELILRANGQWAELLAPYEK